MREVSIRAIDNGWFPTTPDADHEAVRFEPQTMVKIQAVDWLEQHLHLLPDGVRGDYTKWPLQVREKLQESRTFSAGSKIGFSHRPRHACEILRSLPTSSVQL